MIKNEEQYTDPFTGVVENLFGLSYLFPYQRLVMTNILEAAASAGIQIKWPEHKFSTEGISEEPDKFYAADTDRDTLGRQIVILPTGAGKSLCFQLPALLIDGITLVIYPILSLMADQERRLNERGFSPVILRGGQSKKEREEIWKKLENGLSKFIIANPEILLTPQIKKQFEKIKIVHIVIDEAHCVSEWGESFRPSYLEIGSIIEALKPPLVTAFTATAGIPVLEKIKKYIFKDFDAHQILGNPDRPNIYFSAKGCINPELAVRDLLINNSRPAIVFCSSRPGTEKLAHYLRNELGEMGYDWHSEVRFYHAGLNREEKTEVEKWFINNSEAVLCATCAYGMGVDKADVRTVIHRDCAPSVEAYLQEAGRAGRDGQQSKAFLLFGPKDDTSFARAKTETDKARLSSLLNYAREAKLCRRHSLLAMLGNDTSREVPEKFCCDVCENEAMLQLREEASVINFFRKNKRRFSPDQAASVLAENSTVLWSQKEASEVIAYLLKTGKLRKTGKFPWKGKITMGSA
jgi:ATP-dependent DNA helicase RecQ